MEFIDTHCHIHFQDYGCDPYETWALARKKHVSQIICIGCTLEDSYSGIEFASLHKNVWASVGLHPHEADRYINDNLSMKKLLDMTANSNVVAVGEIGLDYHYNHSQPKNQKFLLSKQLNIAKDSQLPVIFHVREAWTDFFRILDEYPGIKGVVHSFTASSEILIQVLDRGLYVGLNGIMTFTKNSEQLSMATKIPIERLLLETDAPFLTPVPFRGKICKPEHVVLTAKFLSELRKESLEEIANKTTINARNLFGI